MSRPICTCQYAKAYHNKDEFLKLVDQLQQGIYSVLPCKCEYAPEPLNPEQTKKLEYRVNRFIQRQRKERQRII